MQKDASGSLQETGTFPTDPTGLPESRPTQVIELADGEAVDMTIEPVAKQLGDARVRMLGYSGSIPGPTLRAPEGGEILVNVTNRGDLEATVHWHGLRLENAFDGTHETQKPMGIGESFTYRVHCPDPGIYWYHPHLREDYGQEMGLYGNLIVTPRDAGYWAPAHRETAITLDDILIEDGKVASFHREETTYAAMGRFGNVMLASGEAELSFSAQRGEVVRVYFTNTANTRVFNVGFNGARMKLVGGDSGRCEQEAFIDSVIVAPSERAVVDVLFDSAGDVVLEHRTPETIYKLATVTVAGETADSAPEAAFETPRSNPEWRELRQHTEPYRDQPAQKSLAFVAEMEFEEPEGPVVFICPMHPEVVSEAEGSCPECGMKLMPVAAPKSYTCPMHPEVVSDEPGRCPECGMKLMPVAAPKSYTCPMHSEVVSDEPGRCPECGMKLMPASMVQAHEGEHEHDHGEHPDDHGPGDGHGDDAHAHNHAHAPGGIEWEDDMVEVNKTTTPANTRWKLIDRSTGDENHAITWKFKVGDWVKIELVNEMDSDHPMHHPFHVHGAGRFLVLDRNGVPEDNLMWKDTVLVTTGEVVNILLEVTNPGRWMAHCHIAEHHESGMMFSFDVEP